MTGGASTGIFPPIVGTSAVVASVSAGTVTAFGETLPAVFGRSGAIAAAAKREGDGASPLGIWPIRTVLLRPDRMTALATRLAWRWLRTNDGWSDDIADPAYNRPVMHPHPFNAERLWRDDGAYDIVITLGHNDSPPRPPFGSAIFLHCTQPDRRPTQGCIAIDKPRLATLLGHLQPGDTLELTA